MPIRCASLILPSTRLDELPAQLSGGESADLLAAWTALWHPALVAATGTLPGWHSAESPPAPDVLEGELIVLPTAGRKRLPSDWCDRVRAGSNPPPVESLASRQETLALALRAAGVDRTEIAAETVADFLALGHAYLQIELLTRAMRYTSVLDTDHFTSAAVAAARAAVDGRSELAHAELARAFDLLADARNHVYSVDFYVVDVTLLAPSTLGESLQAKLSGASPTSLLATGELLEQMAREYPRSLAALRRAIEAGTACVIGGYFHGSSNTWASPETVLRDLERGQQAARRHLHCDYEVFAQYDASFSPLLAQILASMGFRGALHAAFDGGRLPKPDQCKTWWGPEDAAIQALAVTPLDVARPESWLRFAERIADTLAHDHVATILLAGWPGRACEYYDDLRRAARYGPLLGKLVTLDEYFRITREPDEWTTFQPREYSFRSSAPHDDGAVDDFCLDAPAAARRSAEGLAGAAGIAAAAGQHRNSVACSAVINPWNFAFPQFIGFNPLDFDAAAPLQNAMLLPGVPGCGFASFASAAEPPPRPLADGRVLRNEQLELTVSEATGGIQSLRRHRDRSTRLSQRLVYHHSLQHDGRETKMVAERIAITRNDSLAGEITSAGRLLNPSGEMLARFIQTVRLVRGLDAAIVDVQLDPQQLPGGEAWSSYYASRIAWAHDAVALRRGSQWTARETLHQRIESPEWVEIAEGIGTVTCFAMGLAFHRQVGPTWLDTILLPPGEQRRRFQLALGVDEAHPTQTALGLATSGYPFIIELSARPDTTTGWFLHVGAKNLLVTHVEPLSAPQSGIGMRLLETAGRDTHTTIAAFRPLREARTTDFRGRPTGVLSVAEGRAEFNIGPHRWIQIEAEW
jgi:alpha-mannosidase